VRFPFLRSLIFSCLFLLAAGPGGFFDSASAASAPLQDACFTSEIGLNTSTSDGNRSSDGANDYTWDAERGDQIGSLLDGSEAGARRASHATTRMASQHRLLEIKTRAGFETVRAIFPSFRQQMEYDDLGRRIRSRLYHRINLVEVLVRDDVFVYDGWKLITTLSGQSGDVLQRFAWGLDLSHTVGGAGNVSGLLVFEDTALGQSHFPRFDGNGNVIGLIAATDPTGAPAGTPNAGEASATYEYDPFGNALGATGHAAARNPFRFSTTYQDPVTGFSYYGYRFYDPGHGRWLNRDPIAEAGGLNLYGFVGNDPVNAVDVLGMDPQDSVLGRFFGKLINSATGGAVDAINERPDLAALASAGDADGVLQAEQIRHHQVAVSAEAAEAFDTYYSLATLPLAVRSLATSGSGLRGLSRIKASRKACSVEASAGQHRDDLIAFGRPEGGSQWGSGEELAEFLKERGALLSTSSATHTLLDDLEALAAFSPFTTSSGEHRAILRLRADATNYEVFHEMGHFFHWRNDPEKYSTLSEIEKEQNAYNFVREVYWNNLSIEERNHAIEYLIDKGGRPW